MQTTNSQNPLPPYNQAQPEQLHKRHFKSFWPIVIIAVVSALVGGALVWAAFNQRMQDEINSLLPGANFKKSHNTPGTPTNVASWQTYRNEEFGFEFNYPSSWELSSNLMILSTKEFGQDYQAEGGEKKAVQDNYARLLVMHGSLPNSLTLSKYATGFEHVAYPCKANDLKEIFLDNSQGLRCKSSFNEFGASSVFENVFVLKDTKVSQFTFIVRDELSKSDQDNYFKIFDQILSTFKFIESEKLSPSQEKNLKALVLSVEDWHSYEKVDFEFSLNADRCEANDKDFDTLLEKANVGTVYGKVVEGVSLTYIPNYLNWSNEKFLKNGFCQAGSIYPYKAYKDKLLWVSSCGTGYKPVNGSCDATRDLLDKFFFE